MPIFSAATRFTPRPVGRSLANIAAIAIGSDAGAFGPRSERCTRKRRLADREQVGFRRANTVGSASHVDTRMHHRPREIADRPDVSRPPHPTPGTVLGHSYRM